MRLKFSQKIDFGTLSFFFEEKTTRKRISPDLMCGMYSHDHDEWGLRFYSRRI